MPRPTRLRLPGWLVGGGVIAVAMGVMNLTNYGFTILAARILGPSHYGALAALMGLLLVVGVVSLGLQATAARRVSSSPEHTALIEQQVLAAGYRSALALGLLSLLATPVIDVTLRLDSWATSALVAAAVAPLTVMGAQAGVLQGERRWGPLALIYLSAGVFRLLCGLLTMVVRPDAFGAMVGVAISAYFPVVVGWLALRHPSRRAEETPPAGDHPYRRLLVEVAHNSHALLAFFALSSADIVIARNVLDDHQAGLYAGGLILSKAVLFLPQFVVIVAFPSMAQNDGRGTQLKSLGLVLAIGGVTVVAVAALSRLALVFIGGGEYADLRSRLWTFAVIGTLLAMVQLMVYSLMARQSQKSVFVIWGALALLVAAAPFIGTLTTLISVVVGVDALLLVALFLLSLRATTGSAVVTGAQSAVSR